MAQYAFYFDQSRCYSCRACSVACKDWNGIAPGSSEKWRTVYETEEGSYLNTRIRVLAFGCGHCENPLCISACPNGAIFKEEKYGAVLVDSEACCGSRQCYVACPYGAPKFASDAPGTKMSKCTMCIDRLEKGDIPVCVASCPLRAMDFGTLEEMVAKYGDQRSLPGMPDGNLSKPAYIVSPNAPKKDLIPYDKEKAMELMTKRGYLGNVYDDVKELHDFDPAAVGRHSLRMKFNNQAEMMEATKNDQG